MSELDDLLDQVSRIEKYIANCDCPENDVRRDFHGLIQDLVHNYYWCSCAYEFYFQVGQHKILMQSDASVKFLKPHFRRLIDIPKFHQISYFNSMNRALILGTWTSFELAISTIVDAILSEEKKEYLKTSRGRKVLDLFPASNKPAENIQRKIINNLKEKHLHIIPMPSRLDAIFKHYPGKYEGGEDGEKKDKGYIDFYSKMRSALIHNNGIYYGGEYPPYDFHGYKFIFKNGEKFRYNGSEATISLYMSLAHELIRIFMRISKLTSEISFIKYPDTNFGG